MPTHPAPRDWTNPAATRLPDPDVEPLDARFRRIMIGNARIERLYTGTRWGEGPVWFGDMRCLVWSDVPNNRMLRWDEWSAGVTVFRQGSGSANGNTRDRQGRLITCEQDARRVTRTEHDGSITVLMDHFEGKRLNSPNDVVVKSDGSIWFSDPGYGISNDFEGHVMPFELPRSVYRIDAATGHARVVVDSFRRPNGLAFSPDERLLYVTDTPSTDDPSQGSSVFVLDIGDDGPVGDPRPLVSFEDHKPGFADGIRIDTAGNLWCACGWAGAGFDGVQVFAPDASPIGRILLPEICANITFGGTKHNRLFMIATSSVYCIDLKTRGANFC